MSVCQSIYIPRMSINQTEESVSQYMAYFRIGKVSRVDFTPINKKPGFRETYDQGVKSAFVHFSITWFSVNKIYRFQGETVSGNSEFWYNIGSEKSYKLQVSDNEYWICLKNKNPIQKTLMNIHQVVENGRHLEGLIEAQAKKIEEQAKKMEAMERKFKCVHEVLHQLIGGLFCQKSQAEILNRYI